MKDKDIYSSIYDIVDGNMKNAGQSLHTPKEVTLASAFAVPGKVDILKLSRERNNELFLRKAYQLMLCRPIDKAALKAWRSNYALPTEEFQQTVVYGLKNSEEFYINQVRIYNNIYSENNGYGGDISCIGRPAGITVPERMLKIYRKMPGFMKNAAKKIMGING